ncbi:hypothetical protein, unlikely [Trypanosoma congolense IL3000]|uniref:Uncharacterized protein n=1 Tax=Trypanosoma congolense (strain IL3000) TaxID=1068625 RepID=F9WFC3_TRYCI|nr:hypothetical protein, unlikely [Trypanosoma congolense IL3000]
MVYQGRGRFKLIPAAGTGSMAGARTDCGTGRKWAKKIVGRIMGWWQACFPQRVVPNIQTLAIESPEKIPQMDTRKSMGVRVGEAEREAKETSQSLPAKSHHYVSTHVKSAGIVDSRDGGRSGGSASPYELRSSGSVFSQ